MFTEALFCLTLAIYHESRGEPELGQRAVAEVIINRVENPYWPSTPCKVISAKSQFSFFWDDLPFDMTEKDAEKRAKRIAREYLFGNPERVFDEPIKCFVEKGLENKWTKQYDTVGVIGNHKFIDC